MTNKTLFWSFYVNFCTFCASLRLKRTLFTRPKTSIISVNPVILSNFSPCLRALCDYKSVKICVNLRLINDLRSTKVYVRKNKLFLQNEPNFPKVKFNVTKVLTRNYDQLDTWSIRKTKPIQSQLKPIQSQSNPIKANIMPKQTQFKPNFSQYLSAGNKGIIAGKTEAKTPTNLSMLPDWYVEIAR